MKIIKYNDYYPGSGTLFDLEDASIYKKHHLPGAVNVPMEKMLNNYSKILDKNKKYYFYCTKGIKSKKVVSVLEYYGYDVTLIANE